MASTYSSNLRIEKIADGEQSGTWGQTTNTNWELVEDAISGWVSVTHDDTANYTLTTQNGAADEARNMVLKIAGTLTAARNVLCPTQEKLYVVHNATTGGYAITIKTSGGSGVSIANGNKNIVYCDGTDVIAVLGTAALQEASNVTITGGSISGITDLAVADGGTGASTQADARTNLGLGTISTQASSSVSITGGSISGISITSGSISGITDLAVADGGTGASNASGARTNLGLVIGTDVEAALTAASQAEMEAGTEAALRSMSPLRVSQAIAALATGGGAYAYDLYTSGSGTWTCPTGVTLVKVTVIGGGGGGTGTCDLPGGRGGYATGYYAVTPSTGYSYTVGAGGAGAASGTASSGGTSSLTLGSTISATGGSGAIGSGPNKGVHGRGSGGNIANDFGSWTSAVLGQAIQWYSVAPFAGSPYHENASAAVTWTATLTSVGTGQTGSVSPGAGGAEGNYGGVGGVILIEYFEPA